ncbi:bZIP transcription factor [Zalerion maritima]|uniref:BZIP transcription factor n=1 Tax=Zalerion maritima TaxID=339359 RepID=A0AAD5RJ27_9PEZI|nr:bZIP transcription factor [Zalerion maritima]
MVSTFQMQGFYRTAPLTVDTTNAQKFFEEEDANILDDNILDQSGMDSGLEMSPPMAADSRRDSFAPSSAFLSPKTEEWTSVEMQSVPSNNPFSSNNPFMQPQQNFAATPSQTWQLGAAAFDSLPAEFEQGNSIFHRPMQGQTPFSNPGNQMPMFSPVNAPIPSLPTSPANPSKRMRPTSPPIRSHNELRRGDGIRKKNARFDIPAERTLSNIDQLISQSTDEQEIKELKQQKRLLRNRQAALDSRQRKKQHTERLEDEKKHFTVLIGDMEEEIQALKAQMENLMSEKNQYEEYIQNMRAEKEEMVAAHTLETGDLRKKVSVLSDHVQRLESQATAPTNGFGNSSFEMDGISMDGPWNNMGFLDDFGGMDQQDVQQDVKQELQVVPTKKQAVALPSDLEKPAAQGGLLFMLFLVGAFVLSKPGSSPQIPRVSEEMRDASANLLDNIFKEAGVNQANAVPVVAPQPSGTAAAPNWSAAPSAPAVSGLDGIAPSMLGDLADSLTQPTEEQSNEQLFGLSADQYNKINSPDFLQPPVERTTSQGRRNLAEALAAIRTSSKQSQAEVYTRSLLWDQIPGDVVRDFAKMVADVQHDEHTVAHDID